MSDFFLHPVYLSARAAIIAPERAIPVTLYAAQKWLPRLGPERWCLVILLRSLCLDSQRRGDGTKRVVCSWRQLAEMLDVHEETVASWLKHKPIPNDQPWRRIIPSDEKAKYLSLFIPRLRYAYETTHGKTRRTGFLLEVLMEDPVVAEDEIKLQKQMEILRLQQGELGLETYRLNEDVSLVNPELPQISPTLPKLQNPDSPYVNRSGSDLPLSLKPSQADLHNGRVNPDNLDLLPHVKQNNSDLEDYVNPEISTLLPSKSEDSEKNVNELDILIQQLKRNNLRRNLRRDTFEPVIRLTETLLEDTHSTGMFFKVLNTLYPERLDLYVAAVRVALDIAQNDPQTNRGAVFVKTVREFAEVAGIDLGLKSGTSEAAGDAEVEGNLGSQILTSLPSLVSPPLDEALWTETQLVLRRQMTRSTYEAIIQGTVLLRHEGNTYLIGTHTEIAKEWLENRLHDIVQRALSSVVGESVTIEFELIR
jgi:hypothetical protein